METNMSRLFVCPKNDAEANEIVHLLQINNELVLITSQPWGATWGGLEPEIKNAISVYISNNPDSVIYGIELGGTPPNGCVNIDHHRYKEEDRSNSLSSIEQIASLLGVKLNRMQMLIAANDRGYIPGMLELDATQDEIHYIRRLDKSAQGVTDKDEEIAEKEIMSAKWFDGSDGKKVIVEASRSVSSPYCDRLFGIANHILIIPAKREDGDWLYFGPLAHHLASKKFPEQHWSGGRKESGYYGINNPSVDTIDTILEIFHDK